MSNHTPDSDEALSARLRAELPRYGAPASLRAAIAGEPDRPQRRPAWFAPFMAAAATALVFVLALYLPVLPRVVPADPVERLVRSVVAEHTRTLMWGARQPEVVPTAMPRLLQESGIGLRKVFAGDELLTFVGAEPVYLEGHRGMALHYRDGDGHLLSYVALPVAGFPVPDRRRVSIQRGERVFRPALMHDSGFSAWVWRQADGQLACFLVSDMVSESDLEKFKDYFVRVRLSTEPVPGG
jgi:hypothetical protein